MIARGAEKDSTPASKSARLRTRRSGGRGKTRHHMQKVICKVTYDTDTAELLAKKTEGAFGDPAGYEERLYKTPDGKFFLYGNGGEASAYAEETIKRLSAAKADEWLAANK